MRITETILWIRLDRPGYESASLKATAAGWRLRGTALFPHDQKPCRLEYDIRCGHDWLTESATVSGHVGAADVDIEMLRNAAGEWALNGSKLWELTGCDDIDLNFSPSTNTLPIRRLALSVGESASVRAAWLRFPSLRMEVLDQTYARLSDDVYRYESADGKFRRDLKVDSSGFVLDYPDFWRSEARSSAL